METANIPRHYRQPMNPSRGGDHRILENLIRLPVHEVFETKQIGQSPGTPLITPRQGAIRHYMILRILLGGLTMNDKGPYHS